MSNCSILLLHARAKTGAINDLLNNLKKHRLDSNTKDDIHRFHLDYIELLNSAALQARASMKVLSCHQLHHLEHPNPLDKFLTDLP